MKSKVKFCFYVYPITLIAMVKDNECKMSVKNCIIQMVQEGWEFRDKGSHYS